MDEIPTRNVRLLAFLKKIKRIISLYPPENNDVVHFYRPQTKFAKVMLLQLSVSHSVKAQTREGEVGGSGRGVSRPRPRRGVQTHSRRVSRSRPWGRGPGPGPGGCIPACTEADAKTLPPPCSRPLMLREVRILLECILVNVVFDDNACDLEPCVHGNCTDLVLDYRCDCFPGYGDKNCSCKSYGNQ